MVYLIEVDKDGNALQLAMVEGQSTDFLDSTSFIPFDTYEKAQSVLGKRYVDGQWQDVPREPTSPEPTQDENFNLMMLEAIADSYEQGMKQEEQNLAILDGIASLYEAQLSAEGVTK